MEGVVNHYAGGAESLGATRLGLEGALTSRDEDIFFVEVANVLNVGGSHGVEVVGIAVGLVAEERIGRGGLNYGIGGVLGGEFVGLSEGVGGVGSVAFGWLRGKVGFGGFDAKEIFDCDAFKNDDINNSQ
jgi:hypothetical protein